MIEITFSCQNGCTGELEQVWKDEICMNTIITHSGVISSLCISGDTLYSGSWDGTIKVRLLAWQPGLAYISIITFIFFIVIRALCIPIIFTIASLFGKFIYGKNSEIPLSFLYFPKCIFLYLNCGAL